MLRLVGPQAECLFDVGLPVEVRELPDDLAALDVLLDDRAVLTPIGEAWALSARREGRPSIPMDRYLRLMVIKTRTGIRYPNDAALATDATRVLAREARKVKALAGRGARGVRDRLRSVGQKLRAISRTVARRTGEAKSTVLRLTGEAGQLVQRSVREARNLAAQLRQRARGRGAKAKSSTPPPASTSSPTPPRRSRGRSASAWPARRSAIAWCRWPIPARARSARASSERRPSSATSSNSPKSRRTPGAARAA
jgi:hypothetical protein